MALEKLHNKQINNSENNKAIHENARNRAVSFGAVIINNEPWAFVLLLSANAL
jgi:hypothetical protein